MAQYVSEPIAIIGTGCRFPGDSNTQSKLWKLLENPKDVLSHIDRFKSDHWFNKDGHHHGTSNVTDAYLLQEDPRVFDTQFFNISAAEANTIDPQHRLLLEAVYEGVETAGLTIEGLSNSQTAVYVGNMCNDYSEILNGDTEAVAKYAATGAALSIMSNRISYFFNWHGPSMTIDTACSSSLIAVHQAVQTLRSGVARMAVAAGANLIFSPRTFIAESNLNMLSATGRSRMWDSEATGYARGEGIGAVLLKKLSDAIADGDHIECIIRETGTNQDGRTTGITMPSAEAQAALIRQTYARAGLDLTKPSDRPQYFEAHGTGTRAGDPKEAGAIHAAFFGEHGSQDPKDILQVGSIKTVIGHTEGTAGIAGLMKASLALQHGIIPPNLLFNELNPDIEPFWDHLRIPTTTTPWPELPPGVPRRISVNSFGFGGANAHAIVESYEPRNTVKKIPEDAPNVIPFSFSATSEKSLTNLIKTYVEFLGDNDDVDMTALAFTLNKRSAFSFRSFFSAINGERLREKLEAALEAKQTDNKLIGTKPVTTGEGIIGVFTGQGAQWAGMGRELILASPLVSKIIARLEQALSTLPATDRPEWSLRQEMLKDASESRIGEGLLSQPLCTAVQICLVELLKKAGIKFEVVVGHSSGEIACAYTAGYLSGENAIKIAYYRGFFAKLSMGPQGQKGSMLAAGTSMDDADELCQLPAFEGKLQVAASNSSSSITLSGDIDAVEHAKLVFEDESKFARQLKVDTAYHSHHMIPCSDVYVDALDACKIEIQTPAEHAPVWFSSVYGGRKVDTDLYADLKSVYWKDNMLNPVLFSQALEGALEEFEAPALTMEVGPHPALKGPASTIIEEAVGRDVPYTGCLARGTNDVEAFADCLGFLRNRLGPNAVDMTSYCTAFYPEGANSNYLLKNIPLYTWDHDRVYWFESRMGKAQRMRKDPPHQLLGVRESNEAEGEYRWRNYISRSEIPWLSGHSIQGQVLFPAAGFAVLAVESTKSIVPREKITSIEIYDFSIHRAMPLPEENTSIETLFCLSNVQKVGDKVTANFTCDASMSKESTAFTSVANGRLVIGVGESSTSLLPAYTAPEWPMRECNVDDFYSYIAELGYNYEDMFKGVSTLHRNVDESSGTLLSAEDEDEQCPFIIHPATLDVAFQAIFAALGAPGDGDLWTLMIPTLIEKIKINPSLIPEGAGLGKEFHFTSHLNTNAGATDVSGDVDIFDENREHGIIQVEGLHVSPLSQATAKNDRNLFGQTLFFRHQPSAEAAAAKVKTEYKITDAIEVSNACAAELVAQITAIHPFTDILEINAEAGDMTKATFQAIGDYFSSYTYTNVTDDMFEAAKGMFEQYVDDMNFKTLNIEENPLDQEFKQSHYGIVIAKAITEGCADISANLAHVRKMLKPGGWLVIRDMAESSADWDTLLKEHGFSGVDTTVDSPSVIASQAVDAQINLLRDPITGFTGKTAVEDLVIVGGAGMKTYKLVSQLEDILAPFTKNLIIVEKLQDIDCESLTPKHAVLCLAELDEPAFRPFTPEKYHTIQKLSQIPRHIVWVAQGARGDNPFASMMVSCGRCFYGERKELIFRYYDADKSLPEASTLANYLLEIPIADSWKSFKVPYEPLHILEKELYMSDGVLEVPRYDSRHELNIKYNTTRRTITDQVSLDDTAVAVRIERSKYVLEQTSKANVNDGQRSIRVHKSTHAPLNIADAGNVYVFIGHDTSTNEKVIGITDIQASLVIVPKKWTVDCDVSGELESSLLTAVANNFMAESLVACVGKEGTIFVHGASTGLASALTKRAATAHLAIFLSSSKSDELPFKFIHPATADRALKSFIPADTAMYVNLSSDKNTDSVGLRLASCVSPKCRKIDASFLLGREGFSRTCQEDMTAQVKKMLPTEDLLKDENALEITLGDLAGTTIHTQDLRILNWNDPAEVAVKLHSTEEEVRFRNDRTYFIIGATGELGLSLCRWMITRGAKYIVLTSRTPQVDEKWQEQVRKMNAVVKLYALDITSRSSLMDCYKKICKEMPPIAGVANAAVVSMDELFYRMSYEDFSKCIKAKVDGTMFLDELFSEDTLDFFITFSSLVRVTGNIGQTAYAVGNAFLCGMTENRVKRGLAASVMNLPAIWGIGMLARRDVATKEHIRNMGYANISERVFWHYFAEAVQAGHPRNGKTWEISCGLPRFNPYKDANLPEWMGYPTLARMREVKKSASGSSEDNAGLSIRAQLLDVTTEEETFDAILGALLAILYKKLNIPPEDNSIDAESSLVELGLDSLVAVDMRAWFSSELEVDIPILKLLGGATVGTLVDEAVKTISPTFIPNVKREEPEKPENCSKGEEKIDEIEQQRGGETPANPEEGVKDEEAGKLEVETEKIEKEPLASYSLAASDRSTGIIPPSFDVSGDDKANGVVSQLPEQMTFEKTVRMGYGASHTYFLHQVLDNPTAFNFYLRIRFDRQGEFDRVEKAIRAVCQRHEALRTVYFANTERLNEPTMGILQEPILNIHHIPITTEEEKETISKEMSNREFDIEHGEVFRCAYLPFNQSHSYLVLCFHHIATDGFSLNLFLKDFSAFWYGHDLPPIERQFSDFGVNQRREAEAGVYRKELGYWRSQFKTLPEPLPILPMSKVSSRRPLTRYEYTVGNEITLDRKTTALIKDLVRRNKSTKYHFFMAVLKIFLSNFVNGDDICIGLADANRNDPKTVYMIGNIMNMLPLRLPIDRKQTFGDALKDVRDRSYEAMANQKVPFYQLIEELKVPRSTSHTPLFQALMSYRLMSARIPGLDANADGEILYGQTAYDLTIDITEQDQMDFRVNILAQKSLYDKEATNMILDAYVQLIKTFAVASETQLNKIKPYKSSLYNKEFVQESKMLGRGERMELPKNVTLGSQIDLSIEAYPQDLALQDGLGARITYSQMAERVSDIGSALRKAGVSSDDKVSIYQEPTADWICCAIAVWKSGAALVPLDPRNPVERLSIIVEDCKPKVILCSSATHEEALQLNANSAKVIDLAEITKAGNGFLSQDLAKPDSLACILYTSGSTGRPKGVMVPHCNFINLILGHAKKHNIGREKILQQTTYGFDLCYYEVLTALMLGGSVYVASDAQRVDALEIAKLIETENITSTEATPSELLNWIRVGSQHLANASSWHLATACGEPFSITLKDAFRSLNKPNFTVINQYGPTEGTICCSTCEVDLDDRSTEPIPIGKALPNYVLYIVDKELNPVRVGIAGEIVIAGAGTAKGYLNNADKTKAAFMRDTWTPSEYYPIGNRVFYRTGDMGRMQRDGTIMYCGRMEGDTQVKIRGLRIELTDIENTIVAASDGVIGKAIATIRKDFNGLLIAHLEFSAKSFKEHEKKAFVKSLASRLPLPKAVVPAFMLPVDSLPLNNNGKVDRQAVATLPLPSDEDSEREDDELTRTEKALKEVWQDIITADLSHAFAITADSDFFHVGGDSLVLVSLQAAIRSRFEVVVPVIELFEASTLQTMASKIDSMEKLERINWDVETAVDQKLVDFKTCLTPVNRSKIKGIKVLLTGPTGYLGSNLLKQLIEDDRVAEIHCVGVRAIAGGSPSSSGDIRKLPHESEKITTYPGDLSRTRFGMSEDSFSGLARDVDVIIASGSNRSFWDYYQTLQPGNVGATKELSRLALARKIPIHYISSGGLVENGETPAVSVANSRPPADGTSGYLSTKWASEVYLEKAAEQLDLPVYIHRVTPAPADKQEPPMELMIEVAQIADMINALPNTDGFKGSFDLVRTGPVCKAICDNVLAPGDVDMHIHYPSEAKLSTGAINDLVPPGMDLSKYQRMLPFYWIGEAKKAGITWHFATQDLGFTSKMGAAQTLKR